MQFDAIKVSIKEKKRENTGRSQESHAAQTELVRIRDGVQQIAESFRPRKHETRNWLLRNENRRRIVRAGHEIDRQSVDQTAENFVKINYCVIVNVLIRHRLIKSFCVHVLQTFKKLSKSCFCLPVLRHEYSRPQSQSDRCLRRFPIPKKTMERSG